jgi:hypothetical protein
MALVTPLIANTPEKKLAFWNRAWKLLQNEHHAKRAEYPETMSEAQLAEFKLWEKDEWKPRQLRILHERNEVETAKRLVEKLAGRRDDTWDEFIDVTKA